MINISRTARNTMFYLCTMLISFNLWADNNTDLIINNVISAYGGENLTKAKTLSINEVFKSTMPKQSETPDTLNLRQTTRAVVIDFTAQKAQVTQQLKQREITFSQRNIFKKNIAYHVNLVTKTYRKNSNAGIENIIGHSLLLNDIGLAWLLFENRSSVVKLGETSIENIAYHSLVMIVPSYGELTLTIDKNTYFIIRMTRSHPRLGEIKTDFSQVVSRNNISYAKNTEVFYGTTLNLFVFERDIIIDAILPEGFAVLDDYQQQGLDLTNHEMTVTALSENTYLVGKGHVNSIFYVDGINVIGADIYAGIMTRFLALKKHLNKELVLDKMIITHHHIDHLSGLNELTQTTTKLIAARAHNKEILSNITTEFDLNKLILINDSISLARGKVKIYDIATAHAAHNLVFYIPTEKLLFTADYFHSSIKGEQIIGFPDLINFRKSIEKLNINIEKFAGVHGVRLLSYQQLLDATNSYKPYNLTEIKKI